MTRKYQSILAVLGLISLLLPPGAALGVKSIAWRVFASPTENLTDTARETRSLIDVIRSIRSLSKENTDLQAENTRLKAELEALREVKHENELLRQELQFADNQPSEYQLVPAKVISRSPSTFLQTLTLDQGRDAGLSVGQPVLAQGFLIGQISDVTQTTSYVQLITASRSIVPITLSESRVVGLLKGGLAGLTGDDFPTDAVIVPGEGVVTSGLGDIVPAGLPVGNVQKELTEGTDFVKRISINSPIIFNKLELTLVVVGRK